MASTLTQASAVPPHELSSSLSALSVKEVPEPQEVHNVVADFHYYKDAGDGSRPPPTYVNKPESYRRVPETLSLTVHDIRGTEDQYSLDRTGFQIYHHQSAETDFRDEEQIKKNYYPEVEKLLKEAFVILFSDRSPLQLCIGSTLTELSWQDWSVQNLYFRPYNPATSRGFFRCARSCATRPH